MAPTSDRQCAKLAIFTYSGPSLFQSDILVMIAIEVEVLLHTYLIFKLGTMGQKILKSPGKKKLMKSNKSKKFFVKLYF